MPRGLAIVPDRMQKIFLSERVQRGEEFDGELGKKKKDKGASDNLQAVRAVRHFPMSR